MSYPYCRRCRFDVLPGRGCMCAQLQADYEAAAADRQRERQLEEQYWAEMDASIAAERRQVDGDAAADMEYEARRARARENAQARDDLRRGDHR